jgi:YHS domain-containing protein
MCNFYRFTAFAVVIATSVAAQAQETWQWARNLEEARAIAAQSNRLVLIHFGGKQCKGCQILERDVFSQPGFGQSMASDYVGVKIDAWLSPSTARRFKIERLPTDVVVTPDLEVVDKRVSPRSTEEYSSTMGQIAADFRQRQSAEATGYQRPVVAYGTVRASGAEAPAAPQNNLAQSSVPPMAAAPTDSPTSQMAQTPPVTQQPAKRDRYADYYEQVGQQQPAPPSNDYAGYQAPTAPAMTPPAVTTPTAPQDRYSDYVASQQATAPTQNYAPPAPNYSVPARPYTPPVTAAMQPGPAPAQTVAPTANTTTPRSRPAVTQDQLPPGSAPLSLDGYCPVALSEQQRWLPGDVRFGAQHEGRTYLFSSAEDQQKFLQQPHRYAPVMAGNDPVFATDNGQLLSGSREHGLFVNGRIYLFSSEESLAQFERNRDRYVQNVNRTLR